MTVKVTSGWERGDNEGEHRKRMGTKDTKVSKVKMGENQRIQTQSSEDQSRDTVVS